MDSLHELALVTICVSQIVEALNLLRVNLESLLIVLDRFRNVLKQVQRISQIIVDISDIIIDLNCFLVILNRLINLPKVIECISNTNKGLNLLRVVIESLMEVFTSILSMA